MPKEATNQEEWRVGFALVTEVVANEADWIAGFAPVTKGATSQVDWSAVVSDPVQETKLLPVWETEVHPDDGG
jgi:hypothetical protein